jgi:hypothetical protein
LFPDNAPVYDGYHNKTQILFNAVITSSIKITHTAYVDVQAGA